jgi:tetratricopeptide (TPR) repeat protein
MLERAIAAAPERAPLHNHLGVARATLGDRNGARIAFDRAIELDPNLASARGNRARLAVEEGDVATGLRHAREAARLAPADGEQQRLLGDLLAALREYSQAADAYYAWARVAPGSHAAHLAWGDACVRGERYAEGARALRAARALGPLPPEESLLLGLALAEAPASPEDTAEAERLLKAAAGETPPDGRALYGLGVLAARAGRWNDSIVWFRGAVAAEPGAQRPRYRLGRALLKAGRKDEAARELAIHDRLFRAQQSQKAVNHKDTKSTKER